MNILIDMNLSSDWVGPLKAAGYGVVHWSDLGAANAPDDEIAAHARDNGFVLFTNDLDFGAILAASGGKAPSVVQLRRGDLRPKTLAPIVLAALAQRSGDLEQGAILTIGKSRIRIRQLPFEPREDDF